MQDVWTMKVINIDKNALSRNMLCIGICVFKLRLKLFSLALGIKSIKSSKTLRFVENLSM